MIDKEQQLGELLSHIEFSIKKAGFPDRCVALPLDSVERACSKRNLVLTDVLEVLSFDSIIGTIEGSKIEFRPVVKATSSETMAGDAHTRLESKPFSNRQEAPPANPPWHLMEKLKPLQELFKDLDPREFSELQNMNKFKMFFKIKELSKKIGPEKLAKLQEVMGSLSESDRSQLMDLLKNFKPT